MGRLRSDSSRIQLHAAFADSTGRVADDLTLEDGDDIHVFSRATFRAQPWVTIVGAVRRSGRVALPHRHHAARRHPPGRRTHRGRGARFRGDRPPPGQPADRRAGADDPPLARLELPAGARARGDAPAGAGEVVLQPYDNVLILRRPGYDLQRLVAVTGQVTRPGRYALTSKTERLTELLGPRRRAHHRGLPRRDRVLPARGHGQGDAGADRSQGPDPAAAAGLCRARRDRPARWRSRTRRSGTTSSWPPAIPSSSPSSTRWCRFRAR